MENQREKKHMGPRLSDKYAAASMATFAGKLTKAAAEQKQFKVAEATCWNKPIWANAENQSGTQ